MEIVGLKPLKFIEELKYFAKEYEQYLYKCKKDEDDAFRYYYEDDVPGTYYLFYSYLFRSSNSHHGCCGRCRKFKVYRFNLLNLCEKCEINEMTDELAGHCWCGNRFNEGGCINCNAEK